jgi:uncharacterized protein
MPFLFRNLTISPGDDENTLPELAATRLGLSPPQLNHFRIVRKGVDARKKSHVKFVYTVSFTLADEASLSARITAALTPAGLEWKPEPVPTLFTPAQTDEKS